MDTNNKENKVDEKNSLVNEYNKKIQENKLRNLQYDEYKIWYNGDSDKITEFYLLTQPLLFPNIKFLNSKNYFWVVSSTEDNVKRTHSGIPKVMCDLLTDIVGIPSIKVLKKDETGQNKKVDDVVSTERLQKILENMNFFDILKNQVPITLALGDGCYFPIFDEEVSDYPLVEFYEAKNLDFEFQSNVLKSVTARKYYFKNNSYYVLTEKRSTVKRSNQKRVATIEYHLFKCLNEENEQVVSEIPLNELEETKHLKEYNEYPYFSKIVAVPVFHRFNKNLNRGTSIFKGKIDLFDDLDQSLSQRSNCVRRSTPIEYVDGDLIDFDDEGTPIPPKKFNRTFLISGRNINNPQSSKNTIISTSQPILNFEQYSQEALETLMNVLSGIMSPATLGLDLARNSTDLAQREKEKVTMVTRTNIINIQIKALSNLFEFLLEMDDMFQLSESKKELTHYEVAINFPEYASPTFDYKLQTLLPVYVGNAISPKRFVDEVWGDSLTKEEKEQEVAYLEEQKANNQSGMLANDFDNQEPNEF